MSPGCGTEVEWKTLSRHEAVKLYKTSRYPWIQDQDDLKSIFETLNFNIISTFTDSRPQQGDSHTAVFRLAFFREQVFQNVETIRDSFHFDYVID